MYYFIYYIIYNSKNIFIPKKFKHIQSDRKTFYKEHHILTIKILQLIFCCI